MIRKVLILPVLGALLSLGACNAPDPSAVGNVVSQVQGATQMICGYVPTAATVANIVGTFVPGAQPTIAIVSQAASGICGAVTAPPKSVKLRGMKRAARVHVYRGVVIRGSFVR